MTLPGTLPEVREIVLRPYQQQMTAAWQAAKDRGVRRGLIVAATGTGKTTVFASVIRQGYDASDHYAALVIAHRQELLSQAADRIRGTVPGCNVSTHSGTSKALKGSSVVVGSVQSLGILGSEALDWLAPSEVICDEAHHAAAKTYQNVFQRFGCYDDDAEGTYLLGVTATPHRLDNLALYGSDKAIFEEVVFRYDIVQAIRDGWLVDLRGFRAKADFDLSAVKTVAGDYAQNQLEAAMNVSPVNELAFKSWADVASDRPTIVFCAGVDHAKAMAEVFQANGVTAQAVWGDMPGPSRQRVIDDFRKGFVQVLTNVDVLTEGFDAQHCGCVLLLRPTQSWSLFTQMVGRGLRCLPGVIDSHHESMARRSAIAASSKPDCIVVDIVGNTDAHGVGKAPKQGDRPSIQGLVGLPEAMDLEGRTLADAVEEFEELPEIVKSAAFRKREVSFSGLSHVLTQVEMLAELDVPQEVDDAGAGLFWLKVSDGHYVLDIASDSDRTRKCVLTVSMLGEWHLHLESMQRGVEEVPLGRESPDVAFFRAEKTVEGRFFGIRGLAGRKARWRGGTPTDKQKDLLRRFGVHDEVLEALDRGKASAMITTLKMQKEHERGAS